MLQAKILKTDKSERAGACDTDKSFIKLKDNKQAVSPKLDAFFWVLPLSIDEEVTATA
ncbi:MAG: hypothetical protein HY537_01975 [Deltaproteobacteria bacterium]|nr:hypothetical protein [Deltaproteobacteria bacterium]